MTARRFPRALLLVGLLVLAAVPSPGAAAQECSSAGDLRQVWSMTCGTRLEVGGAPFVVEIDLEGQTTLDVVATASPDATPRIRVSGAHIDAEADRALLGLGPSWEGRVRVEVWLVSGLGASPVVVSIGSSRPLVYLPKLSFVGWDDDCGSGRDASQGPPVPIEPPARCDGGVWPSATDRYALVLPEGTLLRVKLESDRLTWIEVWGAVFAAGDAEPGAPVELYVRAAAGETSIRIGNLQEKWARYRLDVDVLPSSPQDDCSSGGDAPSSPPVPLAPGTACAATLALGEKEDAYVFDLPASSLFDLAVGPMGDTGRWSLISDTGVERSFAAGASVLLSDAAPSRWTIRVSKSTQAEFGYGIVLAASSAASSDDCAAGLDLPHHEATASPVVATACAGTLAPGDLGDFVRLPPMGRRLATLAVSGDPGVSARVATHAADRSERMATPGFPATVLLHDGAPELGVLVRGVGTYAWSLSFADDPFDDCGAGYDAAARPAAGTPILDDVSCGGEISGGPDSADSFVLPYGDASVKLRFTGTKSIGVERTGLVTGASERPSPYGNVYETHVRIREPTAWTLRTSGSYTLDVEVVRADEMDDCGAGQDAEPGAPVPIDPGARCDAARDDPRDVDEFAVDLHLGEVVTVRTWSSFAMTGLSLRSPSGGRVSLLATSAEDGRLHTPIVVDEAGTWTLVVNPATTAVAPYAFQLDAAPGVSV